MAKKLSCSNETRVALVESGLASMKEDLIEIKLQLRSFIETADKKYATKEELADKLSLIQDRVTETRSQLQKIGDVVAKWGPILAIVAYILFGKVI
jgi:predicted nuclease with TOPRIM domain